MTAFNAVRFRVKPGREQEFLAAHRKAETNFANCKRAALIKTGDRTYCIIAEWASFQDIVNARPKMIAILDSFRDTLEDLGGGLGVTDPVSGEVVVDLK
ncbi:MAG TPA: DUF718 domain-containing protein [Casimicrobiaceae bacterium]|nr:DUF718 domain-containing protein [Casimicrobiaceae bacterium]